MAKKKQSIDKQLDELWAEAVKVRAGYKCEYCGKTSHLNAHHIYSRSNYVVRWSIENGIALCSGHHTLNASFSAHKNPIEFYHWLLDYKGQKWMDILREVSKHQYPTKAKDKREFKQNKLLLLQTYLQVNKK